MMSTENTPEGATQVPPPVAIVQLATGYMLAQAVYVAAKLGVADLLASGPRSATELAAAVGADPSALYRLLRMLASHGVFRENSEGRFEQSALSECLQASVPGSLRAPVILFKMNEMTPILFSLYTHLLFFQRVWCSVRGIEQALGRPKQGVSEDEHCEQAAMHLINAGWSSGTNGTEEWHCPFYSSE